MEVYVGQSRSAAMIERLTQYGLGETTCPDELPPRRRPWFFDNGAYGCWRGGRDFDTDAFRAGVARIECSRLDPDFIVAPDIVAGGLKSLEFSRSWVPWLAGLAPLYVAVQDGMVGDEDLSGFHGVFVGGSLGWKLTHGSAWVQRAHAEGRPCHIGRVGTFDRVRWAQRIGADSIDSSLPLWSEANLQGFLAGLTPEAQMDLAPPPGAPTG